MERRKLEDLNVIDNFLFNELMQQDDVEKVKRFCKSILEPIFNRTFNDINIISQKSIQGKDVDKRGIQLDAYIKEYVNEAGQTITTVDVKPECIIYDLEPNNHYNSDEKRTRLYHSLIDNYTIESGTKFSDIPPVYVIMILPYDPFGKDRMMYTVKRHCVELPEMEYNDGDITYFFYAYGHKDIPSQKLSAMLKFLVETNEEHAKEANMDDIFNMINSIKRNKSIGVKYMQSWEEKEFYMEEGRKIGEANGIKIGEANGIKIGEANGIKIGEANGIKIGEANGIKALYSLNHSPEEIAQSMNISLEEVNQVLHCI